MKMFSRMIVAGCLLCAAPLVQACDVKNGECGGESFEALDKNADGAISQKEFEAFHGALFRKMDKSGDGKLTRQELDGVHEKMADKCDVSFDKRFDEVDIDNDGGLSKDEAEIGMPYLFKRFDKIDANKDGKFSKEEVTGYMKKMHEKRGEPMMMREQ
ncbi:MAG: hypothetical protein KKH12_02005 [Gammaproteobacteria bacterium]|nr:hypothetical protein [Gammaproteobacteria bacterium]MBU1480427.1 hypothetical protein [Gammaproteobacteria bacterium]